MTVRVMWQSSFKVLVLLSASGGIAPNDRDRYINMGITMFL